MVYHAFQKYDIRFFFKLWVSIRKNQTSALFFLFNFSFVCFSENESFRKYLPKTYLLYRL